MPLLEVKGSKKSRWIVSLSNGETFTEGKSPFEWVEGEPSPWQRLQRYCIDNKLQIKSFKVKMAGRTFHAPSSGDRSRHGGVKPIDYHHQRQIDFDVQPSLVLDPKTGKKTITHRPEEYVHLIAEYSNFDIVLIVDENDGRNCWTVVKSKKT